VTRENAYVDVPAGAADGRTDGRTGGRAGGNGRYLSRGGVVCTFRARIVRAVAGDRRPAGQSALFDVGILICRRGPQSASLQLAVATIGQLGEYYPDRHVRARAYYGNQWPRS